MKQIFIVGSLLAVISGVLTYRAVNRNHLRAGPPGSGNELIAFSLKNADLQLRKSQLARPEIANLAGMTTLLGFVYDRSSQDLILVGRAEPHRRALEMAGLVVAMRAVVVHHQWPLVSIDPNPDSAKTHKQTVRLEGGITDSQFGEEFVLADVRLKRLGLFGTESKDSDEMSYFRLRAIAARRGIARAGRSRFWFYALDPGLEQRDDVFLIRQLKLGVRAQTSSAPAGAAEASKDEAADTFAATLTQSLPAFCRRYPEIDHLQGLYEMVALARGMRAVPEALPPYLLRDYAVPIVSTPRDFDVIGRQGLIETPAGPRYLEVSGGIQFKALTVRLLDGDVTALKQAVLLSRPDSHALRWFVPVSADRLSTNSRRPKLPSTPDPSDAGSQLEWKIESEAQQTGQEAVPKVGGIKGDVHVDESDFQNHQRRPK